MKELEEAKEAYFLKFRKQIPLFNELADDDYSSIEFIDAIYDAIEKGKPEIIIDGIYEKDVIY